tara:strand:+ start:757 stop:1503 length:747 start_codon:yes stop_codon:yes gene_type:complete
MPNLPFHIATAHKIASILGDEYVSEDVWGYCLLGSTVPDIRAMTKRPRSETHFTELTLKSIGEGTTMMFSIHPELKSSSIDPKMKAFLCGYISHLICDETWITKMYRPYFSEANRKYSEIESNLWDRALQLELDSWSIELIENKKLLHLIPENITDIHLDFIEERDLQEWITWVRNLAGRGFSWDRLYNAMNRMHRNDSSVTNTVDEFIKAIDSNLRVIHDYLEPDILSWYLENTVSVSVSTIKRYLN